MNKSIFFLLLFASFIKCGDLNEMNVNPNEPELVSSEVLLIGAELANITVQASHAQRITGMWTGQYEGLTLLYKALNDYNISTEEMTSTWSLAYQSVAKQCRIIRLGLPDNLLYVGISKVLEAHVIGTVAELFGDIPYSEALDEKEELEDPKFDDQREVFQSLQILLSEAIASLESIEVAPPILNDIFFGGDKDKWIKTAYTLKARYFMDTKEYPKAYDEALKGINDNEGSMKFYPIATTTNGDRNLLNTFIGARGGYMGHSGSFLDSLLQSKDESRNNSKTNEQARSKYYYFPRKSAPSTGVASPTAPMPLVTYEENLLILAEAGLRKDDFSVALENLNKLRNFLATGNAFLKVDDEHVTQYDEYTRLDFEAGGIENVEGKLTSERALLREIIEERYVSLYGTMIPFNDARRLRKSDSDVSVPFPLNVSGGKYPERLPYSVNEINANSNIEGDPGIYKKTKVNE